ncbi:MAG: NAD-dependent epimerase/dehydratase family protein, partial [Chloroflexi bacterium]|nr:NAD-dependent epimerase/dehydratase family protein [Chloroflexota bacterium]
MRLTKEMLERIIVDTVLVNLSLLAALALRFLAVFWLTANGTPDTTGVKLFAGMLRDSLLVYRNSALLLTGICLIIFYLSGFYTHGRTYRSRYKALIIFQAVSLSYLIFGFVSYFFDLTPHIPRMALGLGWLITLVLVGAARVAATLWAATIAVERRLRVGEFAEDKIKNVLVIGGAGYIGSILVRELLRKGYHVRLLDILLYGDAPIAELYRHPRFELIKGDFRHIDVVVRTMQGMDAVIHLGAIVGDPACAIDEELTLQINLAATRMIAQVAKGYEVGRFLFASTYSVYGANEQTVDERSALNPVSLYARTKIASEKVLLSMADARFSPVILRLATVYGMSHRPRFDLVVNLLTARAVAEKHIAIIEGDQWRSFVHVRDAADAFLLCLEASLDRVQGQIFNVGSNDHNYRIRQLGDLMKEAIPDIGITYQDRVEDRRNCRVRF